MKRIHIPTYMLPAIWHVTVRLALAMRLAMMLWADMRGVRRQLAASCRDQVPKYLKDDLLSSCGYRALALGGLQLLGHAVRPFETAALRQERAQLRRVYQQVQKLPARSFRATTAPSAKVFRCALAKLVEVVCGKRLSTNELEGLACDTSLLAALTSWLEWAGANRCVATRRLLASNTTLLSLPAGVRQVCEGEAYEKTHRQLQKQLSQKVDHDVQKLRRTDLVAHYQVLALRATLLPATLMQISTNSKLKTTGDAPR